MATTESGGNDSRDAVDGRTHPVPAGGFWVLAVGSVGIVYGDIGTSPLYAFRESIHASAGTDGAVAEPVVLGILSLIFWALTIVVTIKYVLFLVRADNHGEGGTLALMALAQKAVGSRRAANAAILLGIVAAALFFGDALITPALSVMSAVEGLEVVAPHFEPFVLPATVAILLCLFLVQSRGTARVAAFFGPVMVLWFLVIAGLGVFQIAQNPSVLRALSPGYGLTFLMAHGTVSLLTLGAVFLAVTGAEALYADLGHFGRRPVQAAWLTFVMPALALNYFGQGALVLSDGSAVANPFFVMAPEWGRAPMVVLATAATVIASQAVITGAFSMGQQAVQLGLIPRLEIRHTSAFHRGQIYMPRVNGLLLVGVLFLVGVFQSSAALAGAYGIAVSGTMIVTSLLAFIVLWKRWQWNPWLTGALVLPFLIVESAFLAANLLKVPQGGWFPLLFGAGLVVVMVTWRRGTAILKEKTRRLEVPLAGLIANLESRPPHRVRGTAVFLSGDPTSTPTALLHSLKHFKVLHETNMILTVVTENKPRVEPDDRVSIAWLSKSFAQMTVRYGFMESPNIPKSLAVARKLGWTFDIMSTSFFLSRRSLRASAPRGMPLWQDRIFVMLARNANDASSYFRIPTDRVIEIGTQVAI